MFEEETGGAKCEVKLCRHLPGKLGVKSVLKLVDNGEFGVQEVWFKICIARHCEKSPGDVVVELDTIDG